MKFKEGSAKVRALSFTTENRVITREYYYVTGYDDYHDIIFHRRLSAIFLAYFAML